MKKLISTFLLVTIFAFTVYAGDSPGGGFAGDSPGGGIVDNTCQEKQCVILDQKDKQDYLFEIWKIVRASFF